MNEVGREKVQDDSCDSSVQVGPIRETARKEGCTADIHL